MNHSTGLSAECSAGGLFFVPGLVCTRRVPIEFSRATDIRNVKRISEMDKTLKRFKSLQSLLKKLYFK